MVYKIVSGKYESGNEEQKAGYKMLLGGEDILRKFDLYFHWYNIIHEVGHCLVEKYGLELSKVKEEMFVNEFAVGYYRYVGEDEKLEELKSILNEVIQKIPSPVPEGESFISFYEGIWNTEELMNVMVYGYFQFNSVLKAMNKNIDFKEVTGKLGIALKESSVIKCEKEITSANAEIFLSSAMENLKLFGIEVPVIKLELCDNPMIQCAQCE